jgi:hypothetical protein
VPLLEPSSVPPCPEASPRGVSRCVLRRFAGLDAAGNGSATTAHTHFGRHRVSSAHARGLPPRKPFLTFLFNKQKRDCTTGPVPRARAHGPCQGRKGHSSDSLTRDSAPPCRQTSQHPPLSATARPTATQAIRARDVTSRPVVGSIKQDISKACAAISGCAKSGPASRRPRQRNCWEIGTTYPNAYCTHVYRMQLPAKLFMGRAAVPRRCLFEGLLSRMWPRHANHRAQRGTAPLEPVFLAGPAPQLGCARPGSAWPRPEPGCAVPRVVGSFACREF